jgi:hypothetical protein
VRSSTVAATEEEDFSYSASSWIRPRIMGTSRWWLEEPELQCYDSRTFARGVTDLGTIDCHCVSVVDEKKQARNWRIYPQSRHRALRMSNATMAELWGSRDDLTARASSCRPRHLQQQHASA